MKTTLISAAFLALAASTASAQMAFETGSIDLDFYSYEAGSGVYTYGLGARGAYSLGQLGLQLDGSVLSLNLPFFAISLEGYSVGGHLTKQLANGSKIGAYAAIDSFSLFSETIYSVGVEGMASFGSLDVEAAIGMTTSGGSSTEIWVADIDVSYEISPAIALNAGTLQLLFGSGTALSVYNVGIDYSLANIPLTIGASYLSRGGVESYNINASFAFGPKSDKRLFSSRQYPLYIGL